MIQAKDVLLYPVCVCLLSLPITNKTRDVRKEFHSLHKLEKKLEKNRITGLTGNASFDEEYIETLKVFAKNGDDAIVHLIKKYPELDIRMLIFNLLRHLYNIYFLKSTGRH